MACQGEVNGLRMLKLLSESLLEIRVQKQGRCQGGLSHRIVGCGLSALLSMYPYRIGVYLASESPFSFVGPLSPTTRRYLDINDNTKVESSKQASQVASSSSARRSPTLSRTRSATSLAARPIPTVMSHTRTASEQPVQSDSRPTCPPLRTVRSTNFRSGATSSAKPATQPFFTEQPQQSIEPLVYQTNRPRSAASSLRQDRPPSSRSTKEPEAAPITTDIGLAAEAAVLVPAASTTSTNSLSTTRQNVPPTRERQYPFVSSGFIPKSRREREAEAAVTPLPPSPSSSHLSEVHKPPTSEVVEEPPVSNEPTEPPPAGPPREIEPVASAQRPTVPSSVTEKKTAPALVNKFQPSFRPRRGGGNIDLSANSRTQSQVQARKVSAFGAPAIITKVQPVAAPPVHFAPVVAIGTTTKSAPKNKPTLHTIGLPGMGSRSAASSVSSRSVSAHAGNNVAAANSVVGPNDAESASHFSKTIASSRGRVVSNPATKSTATQNSELLPAAAPKHETRVRNATGMTLSQLLKQKPPVHKKGFMPTSKLRGAKSNANLKGALPSAQRQHQHPSPSESSSNVESEIAARVPLPPSPKVGIAHPLPAGIPLPPSPVLAAAQVGGRISPGHDEPHHSFPTIESIKERLSEVLRPESPSSVLADALSESGATVATCISVPESEEPEFTLDDLEIPQCAPDPMVNVPSVLAAADTGSGDNLEITEFDFVQVGEPMVPTSRPSSPVKSLAEKPSRELELRTVLGEVGINMEV